MPRNKYPEETVQKILDSALHLFLEKGYEQTTVLDIVDNMGGLTRGAFYHHFKSKEEVLDALGNRLFYENNPFDELRQRTDLDGLGKIKSLLTYSTGNLDVQKINIMSIQALKSPTFIKKLLDDNRTVLTPLFEELIQEGIRDGSIQTEHPKLLAQLVVLLTNFWSIPTLYPSTPEESFERLFFIKEITDKLGVPMLDDEMMDCVIKNAKEIELE